MHCLLQDANAYLDQVLTKAASKLSTDNVADLPASLSKGTAAITCLLTAITASRPMPAKGLTWSHKCTGQLETRMPWFETYKQELFRTLGFADHETYDYPVACTSANSLHAYRVHDLHFLLL